MRELVIVSGKGGTGKTSLTAAFAMLADRAVLCDTDVDAADLHLLLNPDIQKSNEFCGGYTAQINPEECFRCGLCIGLCHFKAINNYLEIDPISCEGCGVCAVFCPESAIELKEKVCGQWFISESKAGLMVHAKLGIAEENSGKLVTQVRNSAKELATEFNRELIITDGPPGIGCPVIASLSGATAALVVAEPTVSGIHDMERVVQLANSFKVPVMVLVNKIDLNPEQGDKIIQITKEKQLEYLGAIPYDPVFTKAMIEGKTVLEFAPQSEASNAVVAIWDKLMKSKAMNRITELVIRN